MTVQIDFSQKDKILVKDEYHRIKLLQRQRLWEGRFITYEKRKPSMLKIMVFTEVKG